MAGVQERAFAAAVKARPGLPEDTAIQALARRLAQLIDRARQTDREPGEDDDGAGKRAELEAATVVKLAAEYRQALTALGLTPHARAQMSGKGVQAPADKPKTALELQRDRVAEQRRKRAEQG
jgi:hypothetical protein